MWQLQHQGNGKKLGTEGSLGWLAAAAVIAAATAAATAGVIAAACRALLLLALLVAGKVPGQPASPGRQVGRSVTSWARSNAA